MRFGANPLSFHQHSRVARSFSRLFRGHFLTAFLSMISTTLKTSPFSHFSPNWLYFHQHSRIPRCFPVPFQVFFKFLLFKCLTPCQDCRRPPVFFANWLFFHQHLRIANVFRKLMLTPYPPAASPWASIGRPQP